MSVNINWETLTGGPDGYELAELIKAFVHERFQNIDLPKLIRSVQVHAFEFGTVAPDIVLKDVCDPLPDFYESQDESGEPTETVAEDVAPIPAAHSSARHVRGKGDIPRPSQMEMLDRATSPPLTRGGLPTLSP